MELGILLKGLLIGFSASAPLGPIGVLCVQRTLNKGRWSGFVSGLGAAFADTIYATIAGLGLSIIIDFVSRRHLYFEIAGIGFLFFIGIKTLYSNPIKQIRKANKQRPDLIGDFFSISALTISNPLALFLFLALFAGLGLVDEKVNYILTLYMALGVLAGASSWWFILSTFVDRFRKKFRLRSLWWINKIAGFVLVIFGLFAIIGMFFIK